MVSQVVCNECDMPTSSIRIFKGDWLCFTCYSRLINQQHSITSKSFQTRSGDIQICLGDRFLWSCYKWFVVDFSKGKSEIIVRLEGTADVVSLPEFLVAELVLEYKELQKATLWKVKHDDIRR